LSRYGSKEPPIYDLSKIDKVPIALFCGSTDRLASPEDYKWLKGQLLKTLCYFKEYSLGHMGFLMPPNPLHSHFLDMLELMKTFNPDYAIATKTRK